MQEITEASTATRDQITTRQSDIEARQPLGIGEDRTTGDRHGLVPVGGVLTERLDVRSYRRIMAQPTWDILVEAVIATRSYANGLEAGLRLLRFAAAHQEHLAPTEFDANMADLYAFLLDMLDRSDQWEAYLESWEQLRTPTMRAATIPRPRSRSRRWRPSCCVGTATRSGCTFSGRRFTAKQSSSARCRPNGRGGVSGTSDIIPRTNCRTRNGDVDSTGLSNPSRPCDRRPLRQRRRAPAELPAS